MADRSRFFIVPFNPEQPIEEATSAGVVQKRLKEMGNQPMAVGVEYAATGYKTLATKDAQVQVIECLMRRVLRGLPGTIMTSRQIKEWAVEQAKKREAAKVEEKDSTPVGSDQRELDAEAERTTK